jgi:hypothetical protein
MSAVFAANSWPYAIALWLVLQVSLLMAMYDSRIMSRLLRRLGYSWVPDRLSRSETYMVDTLLVAMRDEGPHALRRDADDE